MTDPQNQAFSAAEQTSLVDDPPAAPATQQEQQEPPARLFNAQPTMRGQLVLERIHEPNQER